ncbi:flavin reductase family protein [Pseudohoeflea coraliihabitans]|nr:flavin reductase family protein [Pseudohoeflea sp. DP4N28-3]
MRHLAAAVNIVSSLNGDKPCGLLATAVCSVSAEPPMLLACINRNANSFAAINDSGHFCINVLRGGQYDLAQQFMKQNGHRRFEGLDWRTLSTGAPSINNALVNFDCEVVNTIEAGSHMVFIGRVVAVKCHGEGDPLLYFNGGYAAVRDLPSDIVPMGAG